jgi:hypothetical protein
MHALLKGEEGLRGITSRPRNSKRGSTTSLLTLEGTIPQALSFSLSLSLSLSLSRHEVDVMKTMFDYTKEKKKKRERNSSSRSNRGNNWAGDFGQEGRQRVRAKAGGSMNRTQTLRR